MIFFHSRPHKLVIVSLILWLILNTVWELYLAPLRPGGSWLVLKTLPVLLCFYGVLKGRLYPMQICAMLILLYMAESLVRAMGAGADSRLMWTAWLSFALSWLVFFGCVLHLRPYKQAAKANKEPPRD